MEMQKEGQEDVGAKGFDGKRARVFQMLDILDIVCVVK